MSFSSEVKDELSRQFCLARHCQIAEISAIISMCGQVSTADGKPCGISLQTENSAVARKYFTLLKKTFNISTEIETRRNANLKKARAYTINITGSRDSIRVLQAAKLLETNHHAAEFPIADDLMIQKPCCKRAFIRGAFLAAGSISDPRKFYHFEIVCTTENKAKQLQSVINSFAMDAKIVQRKKHYVVYLKEGAQIVDILNVMEAHIALMNLENIRILKEVRNSVNRKVNCETANINKTVSAAIRQIEDIEYLQSTIGLESLPEGLEELARLRLGQPEASLKELGLMLTTQVGKSGVNHRLRKLSTLAEELKEKKEAK